MPPIFKMRGYHLFLFFTNLTQGVPSANARAVVDNCSACSCEISVPSVRIDCHQIGYSSCERSRQGVRAYPVINNGQICVSGYCFIVFWEGS